MQKRTQHKNITVKGGLTIQSRTSRTTTRNKKVRKQGCRKLNRVGEKLNFKIMSDKNLALLRKNISRLVKGKTSPPEEQIAFLKKVMLNQKEYDKFLKDPDGYCGTQVPPIILDPKVVEQVQRTVMFDAAIKADVAKYGKNAVKDLTDVRSQLSLVGPGTAAWPVAVAAIAAVVSAAAAVVVAVTAVMKDRVAFDPKFAGNKLRLDALNKLKNTRPF